MKSVSHWKTLLQQHKLPCLIADFTSNEVLYCNDELEKLLGGRESVLGIPFYEVIKHSAGKNQNPLSGELGEVCSRKIFDQDLNKEFVATLTLGEYAGKKYIFAKYASGSNQENPNLDFEVAMSRCITILQEDNSQATQNLLQVLGEFFEAEKTYLYAINRQDSQIPCLASRVKDDSISVTQDLSEKTTANQLLDWFDSRSEVGMIDISTTHPQFDPNSYEGKLLEAFHLENILVGLLENEHRQAVGMLLVSNRHNTVEDFRLVHGVARFLEKYLSTSGPSPSSEDLSHTDILTGFYSRVVYSQLVDELQIAPPKSLGVVSANVNGLRKVNMEFGYAKGDAYIKMAADMLKEHFNSDFYRISGDEFISFLPNAHKENLEHKVTQLQEKMHKDGKHIFALGHAWDEGRVDVNQLIRAADTMVYINKQEYYHDSQVNLSEMKDSVLSDLLRYLVDKEFMIYLQPQVNLIDGSIYGAESLIRRFDTESQKMVYPDQFVPLYEKRSIIRHVDIFVIEEVCRLLETLELQGNAIPISVNLSRVTLQEFGIVDTISKICDRFNVSHELLILEVTERVGLIENNVPSTLVADFKRHGFKISLDDFGCAYSNIITLAQIEVDEVKLDKSLVDNLTTNEKNFILVRNILRMCNELKETSVLAEGIEEETQSKFLQQLGCRFGQGYYYAKPMSVDDFCQRYFQSTVAE